MYTVAVKRDFVAWHFLVGGDWGPENHLHDHQYQVEVEVEGARLNEHGYLVDIVELEAHLDELVAYFQDRTLNGLPEFAGLNPSLENLACIFCRKFLKRLKAPNLSRVRVQVWENDIAWATYIEEC